MSNPTDPSGPSADTSDTTLHVETLDARGLLCPLPVIRTQDRARELGSGVVLEVWATDPGVIADIPAWCRVHGHEYLGDETYSDETQGDEFHLRLRIHRGS